MLWRADPAVMAEPDPSAGDPHTVLGVDPETPPEQIRVAAAKAKREYNPDAYSDAEKRDAREAFYEIVAAERALLDGTPDSETDGQTASTGIAQTGTQSDEPGPDRGTGSEATQTGEATQATEPTPDTATEPLGVDRPTLSFPNSESHRFGPDDDVSCRVVDASGEPLSGFRLYAERVGDADRVRLGDDGRATADDTDEAGVDTAGELPPGRWRICAEHTDEQRVASPTTDVKSAPPTDPNSTPTTDPKSTPTPDPVAVTVVRESTDDDTTADRRRLGRARSVLSSLAAAAAVAGAAGVVLSTYLGAFPTVPSALASGVVCAVGVASYLRVIG
jgi:hypothetical protein